MSDVVIRADQLGKKYLIGHQSGNERYTALRDVVARNAKGLLHSARDILQGRQLVSGDEVEEFWALKDVNFEIKRGDAVGIIGRNGAGKSTLLKILSRITEPSTGRVEIRGRVASLLEVGTGFHPELTGRENIFLNGAILGMSRAEIQRKFDEIVAFSEVERFLDTPVKHYSSGMYVRLAFAVAAHLDPEILVVDEVLAVGDAEFQKKCLGKMSDVACCGRTVLFVSHSMNAIQALCSHAIFLEKGRSSEVSKAEDIISRYVGGAIVASAASPRENDGAQLYLSSGSAAYYPSDINEDANIKLELNIIARLNSKAALEIRLRDTLGSPVAFATIGGFNPNDIIFFPKGKCILKVIISAKNLARGCYFISIDITNPNFYYFDKADDFLSVAVEPLSFDGSTRCLDQSYGFGSLQLDARLEGSPDARAIV
ncbi:lipopolysaccharide transport system ATP-binding protein [Rhodoblastus acidophilus]|uniref:ABC transporter ATP-binding protein n=1 Tax=Rhodoblastus acidophilus TaxID=1074 RepID=UPI002224C72F|nr:ABC transporter ATP-binding protein [Rhodoblastus acidophilus]MCW2284300.1 lipopolysaccharide transport system ATP-binding protein [Rhodoblastus acidophilus]MCW2333222.1 lipopolysaccharide transport system ATP-binding protein [Rhodoblastus acidophilus]